MLMGNFVFSFAPNPKFRQPDELAYAFDELTNMNPTNSANAAITISVNGETRDTHAGATVIDLLRELELDHGRVAIERNLEILPRGQWPATQVQAGDRYEIVQFVGGG
jgi:sulfur carrier protein